MIKANIHEFKTHLSTYLAALEQGQTVIICKRNVPIAELNRLAPPSAKKRPIGLAKGMFTMPNTFFDPLPGDFLDDFSGLSS